MKRDCDVLIVGGGLNGPVLALALAQAGLTSVVLDARSVASRTEPGFDGRAYALSLSSQRLLAALGLWRGLAPHAQPIDAIRISDGRPGEGASRLFLHFDGHEVDEGPMGQMLEDRFLRQALIEAIDAEPSIGHREGAAVVGQAVGAGAVSVTLADRQHAHRVASRRLRRSGQRRGGARRHRTARLGLRPDVAGLRRGARTAAPRGGAPVLHAGRPARDPSAARRPFVDRLDRAQRPRAVDRGARRRRLPCRASPRFGDFLGDIALEGARYCYPLGLSLAERWTEARIALAGDAAHGLHPLAGQGLNLGLRDVAALADVLASARRRGEDIGAPDVLGRYARWRRFDTSVLAAATDGINRLFSNDNPLLRAGRDLGLGLVNRLPAVRRTLIAEASGVAGELPRLMRGERL